MVLDILAVGAHPDDIEIGMGATAAKLAEQGKKVGFFILTEAELSSNGTVDTRLEEAQQAADVLGAADLKICQWPDRKLLDYRRRIIDQLTEVIRAHRPELVFSPHRNDRHPDHGDCSELVKEAFFSAGIKKYQTGQSDPAPAYRPDAHMYYQINGNQSPDFLIDVTNVIEKKFAALHCYKTQFEMNEERSATPLNNGYLEQLKSREKRYGREAGTEYAEGFFTERPLMIHQLLGESR
ncbi:bacillithiol biosynthesis deacetylase BshB1 [Salisediminibacterium halotolerans]|uniref:bacillithiol biosynthesis deacetylase BshB1 n=1 Tax=Salisediminibacterium halotolerans TaxID=517425 RepID=UPI000EAE1618|nr:bacillithiol biosynthesis deacetylase BshB1 [Salisediminibacterium halotolerans]RLJ77918.1 bacillithiol biosynthesis deacetylase BshB1 [Actinophytocola xinjiangensis]RPE88744.1 bacillithiol biosynthesis deacetylase BshB1 [Salisediminibacterium halotolerans]TWG36895.1 bacillithiol biosynthesis deacetylase BshB1 [Salisediminibacterium halotolerans]GEL07419.1 N-acetyl-alpha-D-glucosaminyl L-malate deacetylase 1 [Salisediminibacterium halotolerans]